MWYGYFMRLPPTAIRWNGGPGLVGEGKFFDPAKYFIICVNMPGSRYGSISPLENNPQTNQPYYHDFPVFTIRDMIRAYQPLKDHLGIRKYSCWFWR